jgi:AraC family transcriptional regulator, chitin signaling transcriptional activator
MNGQGSENWVRFFNGFSEVQGEFINKLTRRFANLSPADFRLCCYLRAGYSNRQICEATGLDIRSVETARYRLRKKLPIQSHEDLSIFMMQI